MCKFCRDPLKDGCGPLSRAYKPTNLPTKNVLHKNIRHSPAKRRAANYLKSSQDCSNILGFFKNQHCRNFILRYCNFGHFHFLSISSDYLRKLIKLSKIGPRYEHYTQLWLRLAMVMMMTNDITMSEWHCDVKQLQACRLV